MPSSLPESTSSDDVDLPLLAKFLGRASSRGKSTSRQSKVASLFESEEDSEELEIVSRTSSSGRSGP